MIHCFQLTQQLSDFPTTSMIAQNDALASCLVGTLVWRSAQPNAEPRVHAMTIAPLTKLASKAQQ